MRYIKYGFWAIVAICLVVVGLGHTQFVTLRLMPDVLGNPIGLSGTIDLPLYVVIFIAFGAGLMVGFLWEWVREGRQRAESRSRDRKVRALEGELSAMKAEKHKGKDDVLALLDEAS